MSVVDKSTLDQNHEGAPFLRASMQTTQRIGIIGAGFSGIGMAYKLLKAGFRDVVIYERAGAIGGTWRDNRYPGAACDVPSYLYSYSFAQNPHWSRMFAQSEEIQDYLERCVSAFGVRRLIEFNVDVTRASYDASRCCWDLYDAHGHLDTVDVLIGAVGALSNPKMPNIKGLGDFQGRLMHTAQWDASYVLEGKRVGVIGTGASAIQVIPSIADKVDQLHVFQRTPAWVVPRPDREIQAWEHWLFKHVPGTQRAVRWGIYWVEEALASALLSDGWSAKRLQAVAKRHLEQSIPDVQLRERLRPRDRIGCKRMLISNDYYPSFLKPHVHLQDGAIERIGPGGVCLQSGEHVELDMIVLATGFDVPSHGFPFVVEGRGGVTLDAQWSRGSAAYKGIMVTNFPNFFMLLGPNTAPGHTSVLVYTEAQIEYILQALHAMRRFKLGAIDVRESVQRRYNEMIQQRMQGTVWLSGCQSWYLTPDGRNTTVWPGYSWQYCLMTASFELHEMQFWPQHTWQEVL